MIFYIALISPKNEENGANTLYIAIGTAAGVIVLVAVVIGSIFTVRRKKKKSKYKVEMGDSIIFTCYFY